jgi:hypothetical protein
VPTPLAYTDLGELNISGSQAYTFSAGNYLVDNLNVNGTPDIQVQGAVRIWFNGLNLAGSVAMQGSRPSQLCFFSRSTATQVNINGNCTFTGVIFAPNVPINHSGAGGVFGALVGSSVNMNGDVSVHFDQDLECGGGSPGGGGVNIARAEDVKQPSAVAWLPADKELIAVPNPSRDEALAVFRLPQAGTARLTLYDILGQAVQRASAADLPAGQNTMKIDTSKLPMGVYWLVLEGQSDFGLKFLGKFKMAVLK